MRTMSVEPEPGLGQHRRDVGEAEFGLRAGIFGDDVVGSDAELARAHDQPLAGGHLDAVAVFREGRS